MTQLQYDAIGWNRFWSSNIFSSTWDCNKMEVLKKWSIKKAELQKWECSFRIDISPFDKFWSFFLGHLLSSCRISVQIFRAKVLLTMISGHFGYWHWELSEKRGKNPSNCPFAFFIYYRSIINIYRNLADVLDEDK